MEKNLILHADWPEDSLPVNHVATTLCDFLQHRYPSVPTEIVPVNNLYDWLKAANAFDDQQDLEIKYFFSISHAWEYGLDLSEGHSATRKAELKKLIETLYPFYGDGDGDAATSVLTEGADDFTQYKTSQIRVSNLTFLPQKCRSALLKTFRHAEGIFILGCNAANEDYAEDDSPTFCYYLSQVLNKVVYGANYYSKVYGYVPSAIAGPLQDYQWLPVQIEASDPPPNHPVLLVPASWGTLQFVKYVAIKSFPESGRGEFPPIGVSSPPAIDGVEPELEWLDIIDLIALYERFMTPCYLKPGAVTP